MLASPLPPSFLDTYSLLSQSLGCNALYTVISFLVIWPICLSSSLIHFKNGPEYLMRSTAQVFIPLIRFLLDSFVSSSFLVLQRYSFLNLSFISTCLMVSYCYVPPLVKQTTTRNLYITIYIYFLDGRLWEVGAVRRGIKIVRR